MDGHQLASALCKGFKAVTPHLLNLALGGFCVPLTLGMREPSVSTASPESATQVAESTRARAKLKRNRVIL